MPSTYARTDHKFVEIKEKDLEMEQLMAKMKASGMGGMSMYSRDDMEEMMAGGGMGDDMYGDDLGGSYDDYLDELEAGGLDNPTSKTGTPEKTKDFEL